MGKADARGILRLPNGFFPLLRIRFICPGELSIDKEFAVCLYYKIVFWDFCCLALTIQSESDTMAQTVEFFVQTTQKVY